MVFQARHFDIGFKNSDVFPPEQVYNRRIYHFLKVDQVYTTKLFFLAPWQKFRVLFISKRRDKCDTELRKYRFKRQTYRNLYWSLGGVVAALAFHYYYYKILIYENGQVADFGEEYPYYQPSIISMWGHKIRRVRDLFVFSLRYHSASQDYTDNLNQNVVNPVFFEIYKYKRMLKWYRFRDMRDTSFDFMDIGEDMFDQVDDGL